MTKTYLEWIDDKIQHYQTEIARLTIARGVIEDASTDLNAIRGAKLSRAEPKQIVHKPFHPKPKPKPRDFALGETFRNNVMAELENRGPMTSTQMIESMGVGADKQGKQRVYNALSQLKLTGKLEKTPEGVFSIPGVHFGMQEAG